MKTSELTGAALDWAVAKAEGKEMKAWRTYKRLNQVNYTTDWAQGGAIIEQERINLHCGDGTWGVKEGIWEASHPDSLYVQRGNTPLEAAMRVYVAAKLGDEVEVPDNVKG